MSIQGTTLRVNNVDLNVYIEGEGPAVLLLHGFPDSNALWRHVIPALSRAGYKAIAPDQRGFGESDAPEGVEIFRLATIVSDAIALLDALDIPMAHIVGHDYGALVGWMLAGQYGDRFYSYTALSVGHPTAYVAAGGKQKRMIWFRGFFLLRGLSEAVLKAGNWMVFRKLVRHHPETAHWIEDLSRPGRLTAAINWYRANIPMIAEISDDDYWPAKDASTPVPSLLIWGDADQTFVPEFIDGLPKYASNLSIYRLPDVGHSPMYERPIEVNDVIGKFLAENKI